MISTKGRYALRILTDLAEHSAQSYVPLKEVAQRQEISEKYLESIVKELVKGGILEGLRGKGGGYRLSRSPDSISVLDVLERMEGTLAPVACLEADSKACPRMATCRTIGMWEGLNRVVQDYLSGFTIQSLMSREEDGYDYMI